MTMKKLVFLPILLFTLAACTQGTKPPQPEVSRVLGQVDITFSVDPATQELTTTALNAGLSTQGDAVNNVDAKALSRGLIDKDGTRYLYGTFEFANNSGRTLDNLSLYAINTPGALAGSAVGNLRNARNELLTDTATARSIRPTHRLEDNSGTLSVNPNEADFQAFSAAEAAEVQTELPPSFRALEYGYVARNAEGGRSIAAGGKGYVSFAIAFPFVAEQSAEFPFSFTISYLTVNEATPRVTLYPELDSAAEVCARATEVNAAEVVVLGNTSNPNCAARTIRLNDVKIAEATGNLEAQYLLGRGPGEPQPQPRVDVKVNFQSAGAPVPTDFIEDAGLAYGSRGNGTYGWLKLADNSPVNASQAARDRNRSGIAQELDTIMHMQRGNCCDSGFTDEVYWEYALPSGTYQVTVSVGDEPSNTTGYDSQHTLNVEGTPALSSFQATSNNEYAQSTIVVEVEDGKLTVDPVGGFNTKINYVTIKSTNANASQRPFITSVDPADGETVSPNTATITANVSLPNGGVGRASLSGNVTLTRLSDNTQVSGTPDTSGGADTVSFKIDPSELPLDENISYRFRVTSGVKDETGAAFLPFSSTFTTETLATNSGPIAFTQSVVDTGEKFTSVTIGPDGKLYASTAFGLIYRYSVQSDGSLGQEEVINTVRRANGNTDRTIVGLTFDPSSTANNLILWVSDNVTYKGPFVDDWTGKIAKLTGPNLGNYQAVVEGLPRSVRDHETNSIAFKPGEPNALYFNQGSNNAMGAPDSAWGNRPERMLSAAVLKLDLTKLPANLPLNVKTDEGGTYDPFAANAPLTLYATGIRNAYDLVWHSNGNLYVPTNGSASGGNTPATPSTLPSVCQNRIDGNYTRTGIPAINNNPQKEVDYLFKASEGRYYGHPNPARCEWVLNAGNVSSANSIFEANAYPLGTRPDRNYDADGVFSAGFNASANGVIEYKSNTFGGALRGKLLNVRYSKELDIQYFSLNSSGNVTERVTGAESNIEGFTGFNGPLDITEDTRNGNLYIADFGPQSLSVAGRIVLLTPKGN